MRFMLRNCLMEVSFCDKIRIYVMLAITQRRIVRDTSPARESRRFKEIIYETMLIYRARASVRRLF